MLTRVAWLMIQKPTAISIFVCLFFQAEDGIRDYKVTGVQTCALPIFWPLAAGHRLSRRCPAASGQRNVRKADSRTHTETLRPSSRPEIGRASCRERV